jgi:hypothetical protein
MKEVQLTQGFVAIVDDEDFDLVSQHKWQVTRQRGSLLYARTSMKIEGKTKSVGMHRLIMGLPVNFHIDHRNGNGLDNRRGNLRLATIAQNQANQLKGRGKSSFKGVSYEHSKWRARITVSQKRLHLGCFDTEEEAAKAYDAAATKIWGDFACLNFKT